MVKDPLQHCTQEMSRLPCDPHPRTTKKPSACASAPTSAAAVQLLLRRGGRAVAKDESIEFFSALRERECQTDPHVSGETGRGPADRSGKARRSGGELLSTEIGKHDYDWLLTPPTPVCSPARAAGATGSAALLNRLSRATSASYAKIKSSLSLTRRENGNPTSRLARSSSASATHSSVNTPAIPSSGRASHHVRTLSSASSSSLYAASNASWSSTPSGSAAISPSTPATARSAAASAWSRASPRDKDHACQVSGSAAGRRPSSSNFGPSTPPTSARPRAATGGAGASSPKSTTVTSRQPAVAKRVANAVARSRFASQSTAGGSTARATSPAPHGGVRPSIKPRPAPAAAKQCSGNGMAAVSTGTQWWRPSPLPSPAIAASLSASRGDLLAKRSSRNGDGGGRKINVEKVKAPHGTAVVAGAAAGSGLTQTASRKSANNNTKTKRTVNEDAGRHGGAPAHLKPTATVHQRSILRSITSRSHLGFTTGASDAGSIVGRGRSSSDKRKLNAAAVARAGEQLDAFPSTRYDAMLQNEDPRNLTWLNGCGDDDDEDGGGGVGLVGGSQLEPFDVPARTSGTAARL